MILDEGAVGTLLIGLECEGRNRENEAERWAREVALSRAHAPDGCGHAGGPVCGPSARQDAPRQNGRRPAIVMQHGWPGFWYDYGGVLPAAGRYGRCIASDFFGFGQAERFIGDPVDVADENAFARESIKRFGLLEPEDALAVGTTMVRSSGRPLRASRRGRARGLVFIHPA